MFKFGDKVRIKAHVTKHDLDAIGIGHDIKSFSFKGFTHAYYSEMFKCEGGDAKVLRANGASYRLPAAWIELAKPRGHHLTKIFVPDEKIEKI